MLRFVSFVSLWSSLLFSPELSGQKLEFNHFYTDEGLSQSTISAIEQDYQGFMWFGTFNGLNRFDGYSFKIYKNNPDDSRSVTNSHISTIYEDSKKNLWIGTADGVNLYNRKLDAFEYYRYARPRSHKFSVNAFAEGKDGRLWVGGWQGLCYIDTLSKTLMPFDTPPNFSTDIPETIFDIETDASGNLWLATPEGLYYYNQTNNTCRHFSHPETPADEPSSNEVNALLLDKNEVLWVGLQKGVYIVKKGGSNLEPILPALKNEAINDLAQGSDGSILIGAENGLYVFNERSGNLTRYKKERSAHTLSDNVVKNIFYDRNGYLWLGTFYGLNYNGNNRNFGYLGKATLETPGLKNPFVNALCSNREGHIFVGTADGIEVIEITADNVEIITPQYPALTSINKAIVGLVSDNNENIFITAWPNGIYVYDWKKNIVKSIHEGSSFCPLPVLLPEDSALWMGCDRTLYRYNPKTHQFYKHKVFENINISYLKLDSRKNLLIGSQSGMIQYNPVSGESISDNNENDFHQSLYAKAIHCIHEDHDKNLWIATGQGLFLLDKTNKLTSFWNRLGFGDDDIRAITEDNHNNLWISSTNQLYRFNRKTFALRKFEISDGLFAKEFTEDAALKMESGHMVFGGKRGVVVFFPDSIKDNPIPPNVVITDFKILNQPVPIGSAILSSHISVAKEVKLDYTASEFSFEFVALNFSAPQKNQYAYQMEGFDKHWKYSGNRRFASYTNLPAGREYIFRVKASNEGNIWSEVTSIKIYIHPPFWETWWFKVLAYFSLALLIYVGFRIRINSIQKHRILLRKQKTALEEEVKKKTTDLIEANEKLKEQAQKIEQMNLLLQQDNVKLEHDVKDLVEARVMQKRVSLEEFMKIYPDSEACYQFIDELKSSKDFQCKRCNHYKFSKGSDYARRCSKCNYVETIITGTIFAGTKFPITKAFYLLFLMSEGKHYTIGELSELVNLRQQTCWTFKKRVEERTKNLNFQKSKDGWSQVILMTDLAPHKS